MGKPAARVLDFHACPMVTPGTPPVPHVGGPISGPGCPTVLIGGMPAAVMGDMCTCVGPPDTIMMGSTGVFIGGKPAARQGDPTMHGGQIAIGMLTVMIGEMSPGALASGMPLSLVNVQLNADILNGTQRSIIKQTAAMVQAADSGTPLVHDSLTCTSCAQ